MHLFTFLYKYLQIYKNIMDLTCYKIEKDFMIMLESFHADLTKLDSLCSLHYCMVVLANCTYRPYFNNVHFFVHVLLFFFKSTLNE